MYIVHVLVLTSRSPSSPESMITVPIEPKSKTQMLPQPETQPKTPGQLVNEMKSIYAGLVMMEKKYVEINQQQSKTTNKLTGEQLQTLIALYQRNFRDKLQVFLC